jgi:iron complex outermembrane receptor protein
MNMFDRDELLGSTLIDASAQAAGVVAGRSRVSSPKRKSRGWLCAGVAQTALVFAAAAGLATAVVVTAPAMARDDTADDTADDADRERIVVTGSRIRRDTFSSASPIQVIDAAAARSFGVIDAATLVQENVVVQGAQIDSSINNSAGQSNATERPPAGGPGSANVGLRGLDPERTLVLVNGRRLAPAGAGGVPTRPDFNLFPTGIIDRVEVLLGGASTIYGADAVAGVVNIITKSDFEGLEFQAFRSQPEQSGGEESSLSFTAGISSDRGNLTFNADYYERVAINVADREYASCAPLIVEYDAADVLDPNGPAGNQNVSTDPFEDPQIARTCYSPFPDASAFTSDGQLVFYNPGASTVIGGQTIPDWSNRFDPIYPGLATGYAAFDARQWQFDSLGIGGDSVGDFGRYNDQDERLAADLFQGLRRYSLYTLGNYDFEIPGGHTTNFYFEGSFTNRQTRARAAGEQALPLLPGDVPMLNPDGDDFLRNPDGTLQMFDNPLNPFPGETEAIILYDDDFTQVRNVEVEQARLVGGLRGEFELGIGSDWAYDTYMSYDRSTGFLDQQILFEPNVFMGTTAVFLDQNGDPSCGLPPQQSSTGEPFTTWFDALSPALNASGRCVPLDWFNPTAILGGTLPTQEQADYVQSLRTNRTVVEQSVFSGYITGELFDLPGGRAAVAVGAEYRIDKIDSRNDVTVTRGLQASETVQSEGNAAGETSQKDIYGEIDLPLLGGMQLIDALTINASVRHTEEENFGGQTTYKIRGEYKPVNWLSFRGDFATTFRAPNLREQFLAQNASGTIGSSSDPCYVPATARVTAPGGNTYDPTGDNRPQFLLDNCIASGADPFQLGLDGFSLSVPTFASGNPDLDPETADTYSVGFVIAPPVDPFLDELAIAVDYFLIDVSDTVQELDAGSVINGCFFSTVGFASEELCQRISRSQTGNARNDILNGVETSFRNLGTIESEGVDINARIRKEFEFGGQPFVFGASTSNTYQMSLMFQADPEEDASRVERAGTTNVPRLRSSNTFELGWEEFTFRWRAKYISDTVFDRRQIIQDGLTIPTSICAFIDVQNGNPVTGPGANGVIGGGDDPTGARTCRFVTEAEEYWEHDVAALWQRDTLSVSAGVSNVFDQEPPQIGLTALLGGGAERNGVLTGTGYDLFGRTFFVNVRKAF